MLFYLCSWSLAMLLVLHILFGCSLYSRFSQSNGRYPCCNGVIIVLVGDLLQSDNGWFKHWFQLSWQKGTSLQPQDVSCYPQGEMEKRISGFINSYFIRCSRVLGYFDFYTLRSNWLIWHSGIMLQWVTLVRRHAAVIVDDNTIFPVFQRHCKVSTLK